MKNLSTLEKEKNATLFYGVLQPNILYLPLIHNLCRSDFAYIPMQAFFACLAKNPPPLIPPATSLYSPRKNFDHWHKWEELSSMSYFGLDQKDSKM